MYYLYLRDKGTHRIHLKPPGGYLQFQNGSIPAERGLPLKIVVECELRRLATLVGDDGREGVRVGVQEGVRDGERAHRIVADALCFHCAVTGDGDLAILRHIITEDGVRDTGGSDSMSGTCRGRLRHSKLSMDGPGCRG